MKFLKVILLGVTCLIFLNNSADAAFRALRNGKPLVRVLQRQGITKICSLSSESRTTNGAELWKYSVCLIPKLGEIEYETLEVPGGRTVEIVDGYESRDLAELVQNPEVAYFFENKDSGKVYFVKCDTVCGALDFLIKNELPVPPNFKASTLRQLERSLKTPAPQSSPSGEKAQDEDTSLSSE